jgi:hypothetical protein
VTADDPGYVSEGPGQRGSADGRKAWKPLVVKLSWSIASLTRGFSGLSSNTPRGDQAVTNRSCQDRNAHYMYLQERLI